MNHDGTRGSEDAPTSLVPTEGGFVPPRQRTPSTPRRPRAVPSARRPRGSGPKHTPKHARPRRSSRRSVVGEIAIVVVLSLVLSALIKTFLVQAFYIPSGSMESTLQVGDRILVNKIAERFDDIHRGDVVVFEDPGGWLHPDELSQREGLSKLVHDLFVGVGVLPSETAGDLVKRVIGVAGDRVVCCDEKGRLSVNGRELDEPYLFDGNQPSDQPFDVTVPKGELWVMGDHREVSQDSRAHRGDSHDGMVPVTDVVGRVFVVIWPFDRFQRVERPATFGQLAVGR